MISQYYTRPKREEAGRFKSQHDVSVKHVLASSYFNFQSMDFVIYVRRDFDKWCDFEVHKLFCYLENN